MKIKNTKLIKGAFYKFYKKGDSVGKYMQFHGLDKGRMVVKDHMGIHDFYDEVSTKRSLSIEGKTIEDYELLARVNKV